MQILTILKSSGLKRAIVSLLHFRRIYKNWADILFQLMLNNNDIRVIFRHNNTKGYCNVACIEALVYLSLLNYDLTRFFFKDGKLYYGNSEVIQELDLIPLIACGFVKEGDLWFYPPLNLKFKDVNWPFFETFCLKDYDVDVKNREVVDIGASAGDTAIWFAINGSKHVYAFEPVPSAYQVGVENAKLNNLENKITFINAGVSSKDGEILVPSSMDIADAAGYSINNQGDVRVPLYSMERVRRMVSDPYLLKIDCEGCEADIILNSELDFEKIIVEMHPGITHIPNKKLIAKLEKEGYKCRPKWSDYKVHKTNDLFYCTKS